jgi:hypothetical protein
MAFIDKDKSWPGRKGENPIKFFHKTELGDHYLAGIETWDYILSQGLGYMEGNIVKYVTRYKRKNGIEDLRKAQHYLSKLIEVTEKELNAHESCQESPIGN